MRVRIAVPTRVLMARRPPAFFLAPTPSNSWDAAQRVPTIPCAHTDRQGRRCVAAHLSEEERATSPTVARLRSHAFKAKHSRTCKAKATGVLRRTHALESLGRGAARPYHAVAFGSPADHIHTPPPRPLIRLAHEGFAHGVVAHVGHLLRVFTLAAQAVMKDTALPGPFGITATFGKPVFPEQRPPLHLEVLSLRG